MGEVNWQYKTKTKLKVVKYVIDMYIITIIDSVY
jgi:hypothetical protein